MMKWAVAFLLACSLGWSTARSEVAISGPDVEAITEILRDVNAAIEAKDYGRAAGYYAPGSVIARAGEALILTIENYYQSITEDPGRAMFFDHPSVIFVSESGDMAFALVAYRTAKSLNESGFGNSVVTFLKERGRWIIEFQSHTPG